MKSYGHANRHSSSIYETKSTFSYEFGRNLYYFYCQLLLYILLLSFIKHHNCGVTACEDVKQCKPLACLLLNSSNFTFTHTIFVSEAVLVSWIFGNGSSEEIELFNYHVMCYDYLSYVGIVSIKQKYCELSSLCCISHSIFYNFSTWIVYTSPQLSTVFPYCEVGLLT